jgi:DNA-binding transcriptional MocR family regulator
MKVFRTQLKFPLYSVSSSRKLGNAILYLPARAMSTTQAQKPINLLRGWPAPTLLPTHHIQTATQKALSDPSISFPALCYGPDPGYQPLRVEIAKWLDDFYAADSEGSGRTPNPERICITGGASQNLACVLQVFSDPEITKRVWMVAPSYFLACRIFEDAGFGGRLRAVGEGSEGVDIEGLEKMIQEVEREESRIGNVGLSFNFTMVRVGCLSHPCILMQRLFQVSFPGKCHPPLGAVNI